MNASYLSLTAFVPSSETLDVAMALLMAAGFDGIEEFPGEIIASGNEAIIDLPSCVQQLEQLGVQFEVKRLETQNWNALWESNFSPVQVFHFAGIRAFFHPPFTDVQYDICITPKMSFGTGHHATTWQMVQMMEWLPIAGCSVFDFGTGTGILAILAEKLGASTIEAIDCDDWSIENGKENLTANNCTKVNLYKSEDPQTASPTDIILANINKHILLQYLPVLCQKVNLNGHLVLSGLLVADQNDMEFAMQAFPSFYLKKATQKDGWIALWFNKV